MNKSLAIFLLFFQFAAVKAAVILVNNSSTAFGTLPTIDAGIAAASAGDTVYVSGSNVTYNTFTITKSIVLIGQGSFSQKQNAFSSKVNGLICNSNLSYIKISGFHFVSDVSFASKTNLTNIEISGNYFTTAAGQINFNGASNCSFLNISNNIFGTVGASRIEFVNATGISNVVIQNNIIFGSIRSLNAVNALVSHNVFVNYIEAFDGFGGFPFANAMIKDNIFYNSNPITNTTNCTYNNNISFSTTLTYAAMSGTGNLDNVNPEFITVLPNAYTTAFNFHLQTNSQAIGASTTGDDMGFYGGTMHADVSGETQNMPVIRIMDIQNPNVVTNGNVNVKVRSTKAR